jgi:hypothetical protein
MTSIFPPIKVRGKEYKPSRILRFLVGLAACIHGLFWGPYDDLPALGVKLGLGILLVDPKLFAAASVLWTRRGR